MKYVIRIFLAMTLFAFCWVAVGYIDLVATAKGPRWYVQLDIARDIGPPPWTYGAPLGGGPLTVGPAPPTPVTGQ
jgi:hypothetical protein